MKKIKLIKDILIQEIDNEAVIVSPNQGMITTVNETGAFLILYIQDKKETTFEDLINVLSIEYDISKELIINDVKLFIREMKNNKIVE